MTPLRKEQLFPTEIEVRDRFRSQLNDEAVDRLTKSMALIGLQTPISVRYVTEEDGETPILVAGRHRLEAAIKLGWSFIDCVVFEDENKARLWEISENLARSELNPTEQREHIAEWVKLVAARIESENAQKPKGVPHGTPQSKEKPIETGIRKASKELGIPVTTVHRAVAAESLPAVVKAAADVANLGTVKRAEISKEPDQDKQLAMVAQAANPVPAPTEVKLFANWLRLKAGGDLPFVISWLESIKFRDLINELRS